MDLTSEELRVLCVLIEKSFTTPDQYPLTTNALVTGCNQRTSRDPIVSYSAGEVDAVVKDLRASGWVRTVRTSGSRSNKHKHVVAEKLPVDDRQLALLAVLGLRGAQSAGELKTRTERYGGFESVDDVVEQLETMSSIAGPLVRNVGRRVGQSQDRWIQLMGNGGPDGDGPDNDPAGGGRGDSADDSPTPGAGEPVAASLQPASTTTPPGPRELHDGGELRDEVSDLKRRVTELERIVLDL